jgi:hypothetical protein
MPSETAVQLSEITEAGKLSDAVIANIQVKVADKQALLMQSDPAKRLEIIDRSGQRRVEPGFFKLIIGSSSEDQRLHSRFEVMAQH